MRVEQVCGAVQGDRGLAGARPAAHDEHARQVGADRLVLFGLDRGDDVAHAPGAVAVERGEQRALAGDGEPGGLEASASNTSSSSAVMCRPPRVMKCRRRTTCIGSTAVAR